MYFLGQDHIMTQLGDILPYLYENDVGMNILLRAPSGWGKTRMAAMICNFLTGGKYQYCLGNSLVFRDNIRVHFIDEIHGLENPEILYPKMDSGRFVIVLATNDVSILTEALVNRCTEFIFDNYTTDQLREICRMNLKAEVPDSFLDYISESAGYNPRVIAENLTRRLNIILHNKPELLNNMNLDGFKRLMKKTFGIENGMDVMCSRYLKALSNLGGTASLQTISTYIHIDQGTLKTYVEPALLYKNRIKITSKGRTLLCL